MGWKNARRTVRSAMVTLEAATPIRSPPWYALSSTTADALPLSERSVTPGLRK
jgi:hypothetical protein